MKQEGRLKFTNDKSAKCVQCAEYQVVENVEFLRFPLNLDDKNFQIELMIGNRSFSQANIRRNFQLKSLNRLILLGAQEYKLKTCGKSRTLEGG